MRGMRIIRSPESSSLIIYCARWNFNSISLESADDEMEFSVENRIAFSMAGKA